MNRYLEPVIACICEQFGMSDTHLDEDSSLAADCGLDSLDLSELALVLEEDFDVEIGDEIIECWSCINDICKFLELRVVEREDE